MKASKAHEILSKKSIAVTGKFYGDAGGLAIGVGLIFDGVSFATYSEENKKFQVVNGPVYILTHECDIEQENNRPFNDFVLVCPLLKLEDVVEELNEDYEDDYLEGFFANLGDRNISQLIFLPEFGPSFPLGAVLHLNRIAHTKLHLISTVGKRIQTLTAIGVQQIDNALKNHLLRPKADRLSFDMTA